MGHCVHHQIYDEKVNQAKVQKYWDNVAAHEGYLEGTTCLPNKIRWLNAICPSYSEAVKFIRDNDNGWYDQLAVRYKDTSDLKLTSATKERLIKQINSYKQKAVDFDNTHAVSKQKAEFVCCPQCSSKLAKIYLRGNNCPVCNQKDIRSKYIIDQLKAYNDKISKWQHELKAEERKLAAKADSKAVIRWLVKVEYHV